jgi:hypothetical protein
MKMMRRFQRRISMQNADKEPKKKKNRIKILTM